MLLRIVAVILGLLIGVVLGSVMAWRHAYNTIRRVLVDHVVRVSARDPEFWPKYRTLASVADDLHLAFTGQVDRTATNLVDEANNAEILAEIRKRNRPAAATGAPRLKKQQLS